MEKDRSRLRKKRQMKTIMKMRTLMELESELKKFLRKRNKNNAWFIYHMCVFTITSIATIEHSCYVHVWLLTWYIQSWSRSDNSTNSTIYLKYRIPEGKYIRYIKYLLNEKKKNPIFLYNLCTYIGTFTLVLVKSL